MLASSISKDHRCEKLKYHCLNIAKTTKTSLEKINMNKSFLKLTYIITVLFDE